MREEDRSKRRSDESSVARLCSERTIVDKCVGSCFVARARSSNKKSMNQSLTLDRSPRKVVNDAWEGSVTRIKPHRNSLRNYSSESSKFYVSSGCLRNTIRFLRESGISYSS